MIKIRIRNAGHEIDVRFPISESELLTKLAEIHAVEHENERLGSPAQTGTAIQGSLSPQNTDHAPQYGQRSEPRGGRHKRNGQSRG